MGVFGRNRKKGRAGEPDSEQAVDDQVRQALDSMTPAGIAGVETALSVGLEAEIGRQGLPPESSVPAHLGAFLFAIVNGAANPQPQRLEPSLDHYRAAAAESARRFAPDRGEIMVRAEMIVSGLLDEDCDPHERVFHLFVGLMHALSTPPGAFADPSRPIDTRWMFPPIREAFAHLHDLPFDESDLADVGPEGDDPTDARALDAADVGPGMLDHARRIMAVDEEWSVDSDRGWSWWAHRLRQDVHVDHPRLDDSPPWSVVRISTRLVDDVQEADDVGRLLADLNRTAVSTAYGWDPDDRSIHSTFALVVHPENGWIGTTVSYAVWLQVDHAEWLVDGIVDRLGGSIATTAHPRTGLRSKPDSMLTSVAGSHRPTIDDLDLQGLVSALVDRFSLTNSGTERLPGKSAFVTTVGPREIPITVRLVRHFVAPYGDGEIDDGPALEVTSDFSPDRSPVNAAIRNLAAFRGPTDVSLPGAWWHDGTTGGFRSFLPLVPAWGAAGHDPEKMEVITSNLVAAAAGQVVRTAD